MKPGEEKQTPLPPPPFFLSVFCTFLVISTRGLWLRWCLWWNCCCDWTFKKKPKKLPSCITSHLSLHLKASQRTWPEHSPRTFISSPQRFLFSLSLSPIKQVDPRWHCCSAVMETFTLTALSWFQGSGLSEEEKASEWSVLPEVAENFSQQTVNKWESDVEKIRQPSQSVQTYQVVIHVKRTREQNLITSTNPKIYVHLYVIPINYWYIKNWIEIPYICCHGYNIKTAVDGLDSFWWSFEISSLYFHAVTVTTRNRTANSASYLSSCHPDLWPLSSWRRLCLYITARSLPRPTTRCRLATECIVSRNKLLHRWSMDSGEARVKNFSGNFPNYFFFIKTDFWMCKKIKQIKLFSLIHR